MTTLDELFTKPVDALHPRVRDWKARLADHETSAVLEVDWPIDVFGTSGPDMSLQFIKGQDVLPPETLFWDDDLNHGLIHHVGKPVRAIDQENEAVRFALMLRTALLRAGREFGDGFLNSVLKAFLRDSDLGKQPKIAALLKYVHGPEVSRQTAEFITCLQLIDSAIGGRARELTEQLGYDREIAKQILVAALARYLDSRFSISYRQRHGR